LSFLPAQQSPHFDFRILQTVVAHCEQCAIESCAFPSKRVLAESNSDNEHDSSALCAMLAAMLHLRSSRHVAISLLSIRSQMHVVW
jgi:hypothetical protein